LTGDLTTGAVSFTAAELVCLLVTTREEPRPLREVLGDGLTLLCFYVHDWSPT